MDKNASVKQPAMPSIRWIDMMTIEVGDTEYVSRSIVMDGQSVEAFCKKEDIEEV